MLLTGQKGKGLNGSFYQVPGLALWLVPCVLALAKAWQ